MDSIEKNNNDKKNNKASERERILSRHLCYPRDVVINVNNEKFKL